MTSDRSPARVRGIRYLSAADVEAMAPSQQLLRDAVVRIFRAKAAQQTFHEPKLTMSIAPGHFFQSLVGASSDADRAMVKWVSIVAGNSGSGLPNVTAMIVLNDLETGQPLAILDGNWITAARTAAMTAVAASYLARVDSRAIGFVGCGVQAQSHLSALISALPGLARLRAYSRTRRSSEILAERARGAGLVAEVVETAQAAVEGCEVVVTSVPAQAGLEPFLDPAWVAPGGFVAAVDLGRSWLRGRPSRRLRHPGDRRPSSERHARRRRQIALSRTLRCRSLRSRHGPAPGPAAGRGAGAVPVPGPGAGRPRDRHDDLRPRLRAGRGREAAAMTPEVFRAREPEWAAA